VSELPAPVQFGDSMEAVKAISMEDLLYKLERAFVIPDDPKKNPVIPLDENEHRACEYAIYWKLTQEDSFAAAPYYLDDFAHAQKAIPEGWHLADLWQSVVPKDRPWWGAALRRDEPYRYHKVLAVRDPFAAITIIALQMRIKHP